MKYILYIIGSFLWMGTCTASDDFDLFQSARQHQPHVTSLTFRGRPQLTSLDQLKYFPKLQSLRIVRCNNIQHLIPTVGLLATGLKKLTLPAANVVDLKDLGSLKELEILDVSNFKENIHSLETLIDLPIKYLNLSGRSQLKDFECIQHMSHLERLGLGGVFSSENVSPPRLDFLRPLKGLTHLDLANGCMIEDIYPISTLTSLRSLNLNMVSAYKCNRSQSLAVISKLNNLEYLALGRLFYPGNLSYLSSLPKLKKLQAYIFNDSESELRRIRGHLPRDAEIVKYVTLQSWGWSW